MSSNVDTNLSNIGPIEISSNSRAKSRSTSPLPIITNILHEQENIFIEADSDLKKNTNNEIDGSKRSNKRSNSTSTEKFDTRDKFKTRYMNTVNAGDNAGHLMTPPASNSKSPSSSLVSLACSSLNNAPESSSFKNFSLDISADFYQSLKESLYDNHNIKLLNQQQFTDIVNWYYSNELPTVDKMFPWLHGMHRHNTAQKKFLNNNQSNYDPFKIPEKVRFLMIATSPPTLKQNDTFDNENDTNSNLYGLKGSINASDVLLPLDFIELSRLRESISLLFNALRFENDLKFNTELIYRDCLRLKLLPFFKELDPQNGVSLRNFHIQSSKISHISDFIVYCFKNDHHMSYKQEKTTIILKSLKTKRNCHCDSLARLLYLAQLKFSIEHPEINQQAPNCRYNNYYNTYILKSFDLQKDSDLLETKAVEIKTPDNSIGQSMPELDINLFNYWDDNSLYREKLEICKMSTATYVSRNVWFGNTTDFETYRNKLWNNNSDDQNAITERTSLSNQIPSMQNSSPPLYCDPANTITTLTWTDICNAKQKNMSKEQLLITKPKQNWKLFINCYDGAQFPQLADLHQFLLHCTDDYYEQIYLEFPPSGSIGLGDLRDEDILSLVNVCKLLYYRCGTALVGKPDEFFNGLVYCSDGYTESSLLGLSFIIYSEGLTLDKAILRLHKYHGRPFFIFKSDYFLLQKLQRLLLKYSPIANKDIKFEPGLDKIEAHVINSCLLVPNTRKANPRVLIDLSNAEKIANSRHLPHDDDSSDSSDSESEQTREQPGCCEQVFGSLPSRVLPHLYLGSLTHANNLPLLNELGITRIVSVGEQLGWLSDYNFTISTTESGCKIMKLIDSKSDDPLINDDCLIDSIMHITNINDDGIGTLTNTITDALNFIDSGYIRNEKILVHCQVGVSRSATVCIAEVIKRLNISLVRAYLYVRVRRLNVIIQPNLKLMYELFKWEETYVKSQRSLALNSNGKRASVVTENSVHHCLSKSTSKLSGSLNSVFSNSHSHSRSFSVPSRTSLSTSLSSVSSITNNLITAENFSNALNSSIFSISISSNTNIKSIAEEDAVISDEEPEENNKENQNGLEEEDNDYNEENSKNTRVFNSLATNNHSWLREVDWFILCKEIYNLNKAYVHAS
ncbi:hypothetical protein PACTADRAFT_35099 [Pachysolen tannophilus NRRL Y-2460]|uniref:Uncharacterized protein n=1 Tax=Pachysolen tannophilus NRRL Y-2460 TaxID=669874 RepID=A0A1E4TRA1_PACTA|nr:hypothetical protein PACTADRAFT_35099 [Pachysolen tannophilus NRRL Y-2460]